MKRRLSKFLLALGLLVAAILVAAIGAASVLFGPYLVNVRHTPATPTQGFCADYYVYVSPGARRRAKDGKSVTMLVQPNNSGTNSDDPAVHRRDAWWTGFGRRGIADDLEVILLVPAFIRPADDWKIYTHALDRDVLTTERKDLARLDLQLIAMIDHARDTLKREGIAVDEKVLMQGFSASGMFTNRFVALHPERVKAAASGAPGGWPIVPLAEFGGESLPYPIGTADVQNLTGSPWNVEAFKNVPQLIYMGSADDNDSVDFRDGWDDQPANVVDRLFGDDPLKRWSYAESSYHSIGANATFQLVPNVGHERRQLQYLATDFFKQVLDR